MVAASLLAAALPGVAWAGMLPSGQSSPGVLGFFHSQCEVSHRLPDDPIVLPGKPGAAHMHDFIGNTSTRASSTRASLLAAPALCGRKADRSAYWVPTLYQFDQPIPPRIANVYYRTGHRDPATIASFPPGLRVIAGNAKASRVQQEHVALWRCDRTARHDPVSDPAVEVRRRRAVIRRGRATLHRHKRAIRRLRSALPAAGGDRARLRRAIARHRKVASRAQRVVRRLGRGLNGSPGVPACRPNSMLRLTISFPDCWNGVDLDSANHRSHMAYSRGKDGGRQVCPPSHRVAVPQVTLNLRYTTRGGPAIRLASGTAYTAHADFFNAWDQATLDDLVRRCLRKDVNCGAG